MILTLEKYKVLTAGDTYWDTRWNYMGVVADIVKTLNFDTCVEVGTEGIGGKRIKIVSDSLEIYDESVFDLNRKKWPFKTDLFIALQVFEHLDTKNAFARLKEICKTAVISLPYMWDTPDDLMHHKIDEKKIFTWAGYHPVKSYKVAARIINVYKF